MPTLWRPPSRPGLTGVERLHLVLYPALPVIPVVALHDGIGYLIERFELVWLPAATLLRDRRSPSPEGRPVVVGYSDEGYLPYAVAEAERVTAALHRWSLVLLTEDAANEQELHRHLPTCPLLHLATHATFRSDNPFLSWVRLADARLTVADLYDLALSGSLLVVLSACETGLIGQRDGGLVVSLWKVDDAATADLMGALYEVYAGGTPVAVALRQAQRQLLTERRHSFYWAPFACVGRM